MKYDLVIFDCDGVLVESERIVDKVEAGFLTRLGWEVTPEETRALFKGRTLKDFANVVNERLGDRLPVDWMYGMAMETALTFMHSLVPVEGVKEVAEAVKATGAKVCVASQSPLPRVRLCLAICKLEGIFGDDVFVSAMVKRGKPAPDLFLHAASNCGVEPAKCVVIEDSPVGVQAAVAAGMDVFGFAADEDPAKLASAGARIFTRMDELPQLLALHG